MPRCSPVFEVGGFEIAAEWAGLKNVFYCEINDFCRTILKYHFPNSISYENIKTTDFREWRGKVDVLSGGFPCQPFSVAGQRKGADDDRYLWPEMLRAIREIQPAWVIGENVAGILTMVQPGTETKVGSEQSMFGEEDRERILVEQEYVVETVCSDLEREGYSVQPFVIPACAVGAPHRRDRVWFVANRDSNRFRRRTYKQEHVKRGKGTSNNSTCCKNGIASNTNVNRNKSSETCRGIEGSRRRYVSQQEERGNTTEWDCGLPGVSRDASDTNGNKLQKFCFTRIFNEERRENEDRRFEEYTCNNRSTLFSERWDNFPTVSPVCGRNDGLPFNVDDLTIPFTRWRQESIKAYGNAIVPQVAYEIFKAILTD